MLLCYIVLGPAPLGYPFLGESANGGYESLPSRMKELITVEVFLELIEQLVSDNLIKQIQKRITSRYDDVLVLCWHATATGKRVARTLFGTELNQVTDVNHSQSSFADLVVTKFTASSSSAR
jgi:hypothetical protein